MLFYQTGITKTFLWVSDRHTLIAGELSLLCLRLLLFITFLSIIAEIGASIVNVELARLCTLFVNSSCSILASSVLVC